MFAGPGAAAVRVRAGGGRPRVRVAAEVVAGHDPLEAVVVRQHEARPDLVVPGVLVGQQVAAAAVAALVVVVVNEHHGVLRVRHTPALTRNKYNEWE